MIGVHVQNVFLSSNSLSFLNNKFCGAIRSSTCTSEIWDVVTIITSSLLTIAADETYDAFE